MGKWVFLLVTTWFVQVALGFIAVSYWFVGKQQIAVNIFGVFIIMAILIGSLAERVNRKYGERK